MAVLGCRSNHRDGEASADRSSSVEAVVANPLAEVIDINMTACVTGKREPAPRVEEINEAQLEMQGLGCVGNAVHGGRPSSHRQDLWHTSRLVDGVLNGAGRVARRVLLPLGQGHLPPKICACVGFRWASSCALALWNFWRCVQRIRPAQWPPGCRLRGWHRKSAAVRSGAPAASPRPSGQRWFWRAAFDPPGGSVGGNSSAMSFVNLTRASTKRSRASTGLLANSPVNSEKMQPSAGVSRRTSRR
jgi:hypothetical protein